MKRVICLLLIAVFMIAALASCGGNGDNGDDTANNGGNQSTETNEYGEETFTSVVPVDTLDFDGETLKIIHRDALNVQREWYKDTASDELDEVIAVRNEAVAEKLDLVIEYQPLASSNYSECLDLFTSAIKEDVDTGAHNYDIVANYAYAGANVAVRDYIADLNDKEIFPYFEFSLPCWNQAIVKTTTINDHLYYVTGDLNLSTFDKSIVVFINKKMYDDKKTADDPEDLQDVAIKGYWDYEDLYRWSTVFEDNNGEDGAQHDDFYGISADFGSIPLDAFPYAWDLEYLNTEADGTHSYNIVGNQKIEEAIVKVQNLLDGGISAGVNNADNTGSCSLGGYSEPITHFANDKCIFTIHNLYATEDDNVLLRSMESEFGLLPIPKYDEDQENYGTTSHDSFTLMTVIDHSQSSVPTKGEEVSAYLQYSTEESYTNVRGYYINRIVKPKYFGTDDSNGSVSKSIQIFNMIADNVEFTFVTIYAPQLNGVLNSCWRNVVIRTSAATTAQGAYEAEQTNFDTALEEVDAWLGLK